MGIRGFIELPPELDGDKVQEIVEAAHRITKAGRVILILSDVPVEEPLLSQARAAELVIADSERFSAALLSSGILHMRAEEGLFYLRSLAPVEEGDGKTRRGRLSEMRGTPGPHDRRIDS